MHPERPQARIQTQDILASKQQHFAFLILFSSLSYLLGLCQDRNTPRSQLWPEKAKAGKKSCPGKSRLVELTL